MFSLPLVLPSSAPNPVAVLPPGDVAKERVKTGGRVVAADGVDIER